MSTEKDNLSNSLLIERYKYILLNRNQLNNNTFKIITLYQIILFGTFTAFYNIYQSKLVSSIKKIYCDTLMLLFFLSSLILVMVLLGGILSWLDSRHDEIKILVRVSDYKKEKISWQSIFKWYETYITFSILLISFIVCISYLYYHHLLF